MHENKKFENVGRNLVVFVAICQPLLVAFDYFSDGLSSVLNTVFLCALIILGFSKKISFNIVAISILIFLGFCLVSALQYNIRFPEYGAGFFPSPLIKIVFLMSLMLLGAAFYGEDESEEAFLNIAPLVIILVFSSQVFGLIIGVEAIADDYQYALVGIAKHPAITANLLLGVMPIAFLLAVRGRPFWMFFAFLLVALTFRRSALIIALFYVLAYVYTSFRSGKSSLISNIFISFLFFAPFLIPLLPGDVADLIIARIADLGGGNNSEEALGAGRSVFWKIAIDNLMNGDIFNFYFGYGFGSLPNLLYNRFGIAIGGHNDFIDFTYSFGVIAAFLLALFYAALLLEGSKISEHGERLTLLITLFSLFFLSMTSGGVFEPLFSATFILIGFLLSKNSKREGI
jgi:hypothetical protein